MDLKSKQCPVGEFSTSYSCCLLPTSPALYPKETSSQSVILSLEGLEKAVPVVARVGGDRVEVPEESKGFACQSGLPWLANPEPPRLQEARACPEPRRPALGKRG